MRIVTLMLGVALVVPSGHAESHPSWWTYAEPESTALVGIQWQTLRDSPFGPAVRAALSDFPDLPLIFESRQILLSSPGPLAILSGSFAVEALRKQAVAKGLKPSSYRGIELFIAPGKDTLSVAQLTEQVILVGPRKSLERAVDRSLAETGRRYSPLLSRAAKLGQGSDLWVVSTQLPDPLASEFVPLEIEADGFEGWVSLRDGLQVGAAIDAGSAERAASVAENLRQSIPTMPSIARTMDVKVDSNSVVLSLDVTSDQLTAAMKPSEAPKSVVEDKKVEDKRVEEKKAEEPAPEGPQIIRIFGLDDGPREIVLPPPPKARQQL